MKTFKKFLAASVLAIGSIFGLVIGSPTALAATTPAMGLTDTFGILSSTYTNTVGGTTIDGDLGYTTGPAVAPTVTGTTYIADGTYNQAGIDQGAALANLNSQACTHTFPAGAVDLATDTSHGTIGIYTPGVYCTTASSAASIGAGGITLDGSGTYIFRIDGALTTVANSVVSVSGGASACDIFWTPTGATTLGADSTFLGTDIDNSGITIGSTITWTGRALAFGGTVSTTSDTITAPTCSASGAILRIVKSVVNDNTGTSTASDFTLHVKSSGTDVAGSPAAGATTPGTSYSLDPGTYVVSEDANANYTTTFSGDCDASGNVTLVAGDDKTCTITNNDVAPTTVADEEDTDEPEIKVTKKASDTDIRKPKDITFTFKVTNEGNVPLSDVKIDDDECNSIDFVSGDSNDDSILDLNEEWKYTCEKEIDEDETNKVTVKGTANGVEVSDTDRVTVDMHKEKESSTPRFPAAGIGNEDNSEGSIVLLIRSLCRLIM